jgi:hypothetical protein
MSYASQAPSGLLCDLLEHPEETVITNTLPNFGWIYNPSGRDDAQSAYHIIVAASQGLADAGTGDVWDSGWIRNSASINVPYAGARLALGANYYWRVQTTDNAGQTGPFSVVQHFVTGSETNVFAGRYPLRFVAAHPMLLTKKRRAGGSPTSVRTPLVMRLCIPTVHSTQAPPRRGSGKCPTVLP